MATLRPFKGEIVSARPTPNDPDIAGDALADWVMGQIDRTIPSEEFPEELTYGIAEAIDPATHVGAVGSAGTSAPAGRSLLYLDVGAWIGGSDPTTSHWRKADPANYKRDFGIVCGAHVLLCTFKEEAHKADDARWTQLSIGADSYLKSIAALLAALRATRPTTRVVRYLVSDHPLATRAEARILNVIVGDMHLPLLDQPEHTYCDATPAVDPEAVAAAERARPHASTVKKLAEAAVLGPGGLFLEHEIKSSGYVPADSLAGPDVAYLVSALVPSSQGGLGVVSSLGTGGASPPVMPALAKALLDLGIARPVTTPVDAGERVPRRGRVDVGPLYDLVTRLVPRPTDADALKNVVAAIELLRNGQVVRALAPNAATLLRLPVKMAIPSGDDDLPLETALHHITASLDDWEDVQDRWGVENASMTRASAERWYELYRLGEGGMPPADICEDAAEDFLVFAKALASYADVHANDDFLPIRFCQLGDMLDFWIGFGCHYLPAANAQAWGFETTTGANDLPIDVTRPSQPDVPATGIDDVRYWTKRCLVDTKQGRALAAATAIIEAFSREGVEPTFCYGNHDNYLGAAAIGLAGPNAPWLRPRVPYSNRGGVWMEHGHQWDAPNVDNNPLLPLSRLLVGTNAPQGQLASQAAFVRPQPMRAFEDAISGAMTRMSHQGEKAGSVGFYSQRLKQIAYAADKFRGDASFYAYAMGHTHSACLCRVKVRSNEARAELDDYRTRARRTPPRVFLIHGVGDPSWGEMKLGARCIADVSWNGALGMEKHDWISLEDPSSAPGTPRDGFWRWIGEDNVDGSARIPRIPGGQYVARLYADEDGESMVAQSSPIFVPGLSIESPPGVLDEGSSVVADVPSFDMLISGLGPTFFLRWALPMVSAKFDELSIRIVLALQGEDGDAATLAASSEAGTRPSFSLDTPMSVSCERRAAPRDFQAFVYREVARRERLRAAFVAVAIGREAGGEWQSYATAPFVCVGRHDPR